MSLAKSNKYLATARQRNAAIERNARDSSIFEGASRTRNISAPAKTNTNSYGHIALRKASSKKAVKGS